MRTSLGLLFIYSLTGWKGCGGGVAEKGDVEEEKEEREIQGGAFGGWSLRLQWWGGRGT